MAGTTPTRKARNLVIVLGDQLNRDSAAFDDFDRDADAVLMMEVEHEATYIPQHKLRLTLFFSAMRHFRDALMEEGLRVHYSTLEDDNNRGSFAEEVKRWVNKTRPEQLIVGQPGEFRVQETLEQAARDTDCELVIREDRHFYCDLESFREHAGKRKTLLLETFYREMRRRNAVLMDDDGPVGGRWNYDQDNREKLAARDAGDIKAPRSFKPDDITREVMAMVERRFPHSPGDTGSFDYPVTATQAGAALRDFIKHRLPRFGTYQDAMVTGEPYLYHSRLSSAMNLHLLDPRDVVNAAVKACEDGSAPINSVEGFVRQILGWREFIRGVYWLKMPGYQRMNAFGADLPMPAFMWTGETEMNCVHNSVRQLIEHGYAHHIQRLMVLGLYALLLGVDPYEVHRWHLSMYVDAVDWVSLPNVLGMSQYGDGGVVGTKPYAASGNYIHRMSDYCGDCCYDPKRATGEGACPFTTLYWDFLSRNRQKIGRNRRMSLQFKNLDRKDKQERRAIREQAAGLKQAATSKTYL